MVKCTKLMGVTYVVLGILHLLNVRDDVRIPRELRIRGISGGIRVEASRKLSEDFRTGMMTLNKLSFLCIFFYI